MGPADPELVSIAVGLAGITVALRGLPAALAPDLERRYGRFASDAAPALTIDVEPSVVAAHRPDGDTYVDDCGDGRLTIRYGALEAELRLADGVGTARVPDNLYIVDSLLRIVFTLVLGERDGMLLHACGIADGATAYVCFGRSGAGKTTVARSVPPDDVLCDELTAVRIIDGQPWAFGTPFHGDLPLVSPRGLPLGALVQLRKSTAETIAPLSPAAATRALLGATLFFARSPTLVERSLALCERMSATGVYVLQFHLHSDVRQLVRHHLEQHAHAATRPAAGPHPRG